MGTVVAKWHRGASTACRQYSKLEENAGEFEALPEYRRLLDHAEEFGFVLSYPRQAQAGIPFEPWHWRYERP